MRLRVRSNFRNANNNKELTKEMNASVLALLVGLRVRARAVRVLISTFVATVKPEHLNEDI